MDGGSNTLDGLVGVPEMLRDYFQESGRSLQEYFRFPEMQHIKNPVHMYFRIHGDGGTTGQGWMDEGTLPIEEHEDGWLSLGAEHQELAKIAVTRSGNRHYCALAWDDLHVGPLLRATGAVMSTAAYLVTGSFLVTRAVLGSIASVAYSPRPWVPPPDAPAGDRFVEESVELDGNTWWFRVWLPADLETMRRSPEGLGAFMLLHGFKECGWDNWWQTQSGLASTLMASDRWARWFPGILVLPQLPRRPCDDDWWQHWRDPYMQKMALACLQKAVAKYGANRRRLYLVGESLGTEGAWYLAAAEPGVFAAVGGSCGSVEPYNWSTWEWGSAPEQYGKLAAGIARSTPMFIAHGAQDAFVPIDQARRFVAALSDARKGSSVASILGRAASGEVVFKEYEDCDHHCWDRAYSEGGMIQWLASHTRP